MRIAALEFELKLDDGGVWLMGLLCLLDEGGELCASVTHATVEHAEVLLLLAHTQELLQLTERVEADGLLGTLTIALIETVVADVLVVGDVARATLRRARRRQEVHHFRHTTLVQLPTLHVVRVLLLQ